VGVNSFRKNVYPGQEKRTRLQICNLSGGNGPTPESRRRDKSEKRVVVFLTAFKAECLETNRRDCREKKSLEERG